MTFPIHMSFKIRCALLCPDGYRDLVCLVTLRSRSKDGHKAHNGHEGFTDIIVRP